MRLTPEQVAEEKKYLSELKERVWFGEHGLTSAEQDLFDTIEALQQENEQLRAQVAQSRKALTIVSDYYSNVLNMAAWKTVKEALAAIDEIGGKEDV